MFVTAGGVPLNTGVPEFPSVVAFLFFLLTRLGFRAVLLRQPLCEFGFDRSMLRSRSYVFPFIRIRLMIIELLGSVRVSDVAPAIGSNRMIVALRVLEWEKFELPQEE